jgi:hypothetical protein
MKTLKKVVRGLTVLGGVAFITWFLIMWFDYDSIIPPNAIEYHTKEEITNFYRENKALLNSVKDSVLSSKSLLRALDRSNEGDIDVWFQSDKKYFDEEQWVNIVSVFENLHPYMIMMERKGRPLIFYMPFGSLEEDDTTKRTYLYWFPNEEEREYHEKPGVFPDGVFTQLDEGWYIVEETDTR